MQCSLESAVSLIKKWGEESATIVMASLWPGAKLHVTGKVLAALDDGRVHIGEDQNHVLLELEGCHIRYGDAREAAPEFREDCEKRHESMLFVTVPSLTKLDLDAKSATTLGYVLYELKSDAPSFDWRAMVEGDEEP